MSNHLLHHVTLEYRQVRQSGWSLIVNQSVAENAKSKPSIPILNLSLPLKKKKEKRGNAEPVISMMVPIWA